MMFLLLVILCGAVYAVDTVTGTSTINGETINWEYNLNSSNEIENLKCTNVEKLNGSITIPSTLDGKAVVSLANEAFKSASEVTEIVVPSSVKIIGYKAFENCTKLNKVNLGSVEDISFSIFKGCTSLTELTIPKTLKKGSVTPCLDNQNITKITFEDGLTIIPDYLCANTGITEIVVPSSVKTIGHKAFENCTKLNKVNLGSVEDISFSIFKGCTSLTELTIPKTLKKGSVTPCLDNQNITKITFEDGLTIIPDYLCANTGITEIVVPSSVKTIGQSAFRDCTSLKKITILDNVNDMGTYNISNSDSVFQNHDENLTIYCYEDSMAAKYAIKYKIKYVYLKKENTGNTIDDSNTKKDEVTNDTTISTGKLPQTGEKNAIFILIAIVVIGGGVLFIRKNKYKDIK